MTRPCHATQTSVKYNNHWSTQTTSCTSSFPGQMKVNFHIPGKRGSQDPLLKLQLFPTIMLAVDCCVL